MILKTNRYKQISSGKFIQSILTYKLMRPVSILQLPKELKNRLTQQIHKKFERGKCQSH